MLNNSIFKSVLMFLLLLTGLQASADNGDAIDISQAYMQSYFDCFNARDFECLSVIFDDDVVYEGEYWTLAGQAAFFAFYRKAWQHLNEHISVVSVRTQDSMVHVHLKNRIEVFKDFPDFPSRSLKAGDVMQLEGEVVYLVEDGHIRYIDDK